MTNKDFINQLEENFKEGIEIVKQKNHDYAKDTDPFANFRSAEVIGSTVERAILIRTLDKMSRIGNLLDKEAKVKDESISDTLLDAINYLNILKVYIEHE